MEEFIGGLWHRFITRAATRSYPQAAVRLADMERTAGILFRALGGDPGLRVAPAAEIEHGARRNWLQRIAHVGEKAAHAARDDETLRLPAEIALFPERSQNRDLYLWLIAQGAANFLVPFFAGMPVTGTIARTVTNLRSGATSPISGMVHALFLALIDIDHFKSVNDRFGHLCGDEVILYVVDKINALNEQCSGWAARIGGDEFLLACPFSDKDYVERLCLEMSETITGHSFKKGHSEYSIAISCGVAAYDGQETLEEFLERVDMKMYEDKVQKKQ